MAAGPRANYVLGGVVSLVVNSAQPIRLVGTTLLLKVEQTCRIVRADDGGGYRLTTTLYAYTVIDSDGRPILAYHWHTLYKPKYPHVHVYVANHPAVPRLPGAHLPTARIALEDVLYLALDDLRAHAIRPNWRGTLKDTKTRFLRYRTWGEWPPPRRSN